jgi:hypothetical protein
VSAPRYVVAGLARSRSTWLRTIARWATSGAAPIELVMCVSAAELVARLADGRPTSAVLLDGSLPSVDRDLLDLAVRSSAVALVVSDNPMERDWYALGAAAVLPETFSRELLLDTLAEHARPTGRPGREVFDAPNPMPAPVGLRASVAAVCGSGGTGTSTVAAALAQGLVSSPRLGPVVLVDLALHAEQAMLHDIGEIAPGIQELVEAHRAGTPSEAAVRALAHPVEGRGYELVPGLRRARQWTTVRPRAFEAAFESICRAYEMVVCDIDANLEEGSRSGEPADRGLFARTATTRADVVLAVGRAGTKGIHSLARVIGDLLEWGVPSNRLLPVVSEAPGSPATRAALVSTLGELAAPGGAGIGPVLFLPSRRVDQAVRDGMPVPAPLPALVIAAFFAVLARSGPRAQNRLEPQLVAPGSLGLV